MSGVCLLNFHPEQTKVSIVATQYSTPLVKMPAKRKHPEPKEEPKVEVPVEEPEEDEDEEDEDEDFGGFLGPREPEEYNPGPVDLNPLQFLVAPTVRLIGGDCQQGHSRERASSIALASCDAATCMLLHGGAARCGPANRTFFGRSRWVTADQIWLKLRDANTVSVFGRKRASNDAYALPGVDLPPWIAREPSAGGSVVMCRSQKPSS